MKLTELYRQRHKALERYVRRLLGNGDDAADVSQEAFLRAYAAELGHATPMSEALLYTVARNLALTELRKRTYRATDAMEDMSDLQLHDPRGNPEADLERQQMIAAIEMAMSRMAPKCLEVFRLRKIEDASHASIAKQLDISTKTVERHMTRALQLCHESLLEKTAKTSTRSLAVTGGRQRE
ncbi:MAG: RNA polymerase sigma factor [Rhodoferax sp.]|jgi:RNA polymerase sigma-70 factor (ECF subfamily)|nr:RNA polymerase sigma factor [Rhodoferax sp.]